VLLVEREKSDLFGKYLGKLKVKVDSEELELDVRLKDKHKIMSLMSKFGKEITEEALEGMSAIFLEILKRSYPEEKVEALEAFLTKKFEPFLTGISIAFGWTTEKELKRRLEEGVKKGILSSEEES